MNGGCYYCGTHEPVLESGMPRDPTVKRSLAVCQKKACREKVTFTKGGPNV